MLFRTESNSMIEKSNPLSSLNRATRRSHHVISIKRGEGEGEGDTGEGGCCSDPFEDEEQRRAMRNKLSSTIPSIVQLEEYTMVFGALQFQVVKKGPDNFLWSRVDNFES